MLNTVLIKLQEILGKYNELDNDMDTEMFFRGEIKELQGFIIGYQEGEKSNKFYFCKECKDELENYEDDECLKCMNSKYKH